MALGPGVDSAMATMSRMSRSSSRHLALDQGDHGIASAKGEGADFGKSPEQLTGFGQICGHGNRSFRALGFLPQRTLFRDIHQSI